MSIYRNKEMIYNQHVLFKLLQHTMNYQDKINQNMQGKFHQLKITYAQFLSMNRDLSNTQIAQYYIYKQIDRGTYGSIYLGMDDSNQKFIAAKLLDLEAIKLEKIEEVQQIRKRLSGTQPQLMMMCNSQNIVKCYDVYQNDSLKIMIIQYCQGMNLQKEIEKKGRIPQDDAILIMRQIINGIAEMHKKRIIHRDLKAANILNHYGVYKIADLGFSKQIMQTTSTGLGSITTMAPQVMQRQPYGMKADIWSIGVIFFQMIYGKPPYDSKTAFKMYNQIKNKKILDKQQFTYNGYKASKGVTSFLKQVLVVDSKQRIDWTQLQSHPLFKDPQKLGSQFRIRTSINSEGIPPGWQQQQRLVQNDLVLQMGQSISIEILGNSALSKRQSQILTIKNEQQELNQQVRKYYLQCLKTQLIYQQIFQKIIQNQLYDLQQRSVIEMVYLLLTRSRNNLSNINHKLKYNNDYIVVNLKETVSNLSKKVTQNWDLFSDKLKATQSKIVQILIDKISSIFSPKLSRQKLIYLDAIEGFDYSKQEHIQFTYKEYIEQLKAQIIVRPGVKIDYIKQLLNKYIQINMITQQDLQTSKLTFYEYIEQVILK